MREARLWQYGHRDLGEESLPDGGRVLRPVVVVGAPGSVVEYEAVVDSGSPISIASSELFGKLGIDLSVDEPLYEVPMGVGGVFTRIAVFEVELELLPPLATVASAVKWRLHLGSRGNWRMPISVLLGQRGWFDQFPTTIDGMSTTVHLPDDLSRAPAGRGPTRLRDLATPDVSLRQGAHSTRRSARGILAPPAARGETCIWSDQARTHIHRSAAAGLDTENRAPGQPAAARR